MISTRFATALATAIVLGCLVTPFATADQAPRQDLRSPDTRDAIGAPHSTTQDYRSPDTRDASGAVGYASPAETTGLDHRSPDTADAAALASSQGTDLRAPDTIDAAAGRSHPTIVVSARSRPGFDFGDASIGGAAVLAMALLVGGALTLVQRGRKLSV